MYPVKKQIWYTRDTLYDIAETFVRQYIAQAVKPVCFEYLDEDGTILEIAKAVLNETLLKKLNLYGAMHKNWLPNSYGQKAYKSMTAEEQAVIDSFEGEKTYMTDMQNAEKRQFLLNLSTQSAVPQLTQQ